MKVARYTYSRISRASANGDKAKAGVGWSAEGVAKFSALANQVKEDRRLLGKEFNKELYKKVVLRSRAAAANKSANQHQVTRQKPIPYDDLEDCDVFDSDEDNNYDEEDDDDNELMVQGATPV